MSDYARRHHPQVQARRDPNAIALNSFKRERYIAALKAMGREHTHTLDKVQAWKLVCADPRAIKWLMESRAKAEEAVRPDTAQAQGMLPRGDGGAIVDVTDDAASRPATGRSVATTVSGDRDGGKRQR